MYILTGNSLPGECGVADYATQLTRHLKEQGVEVRQVILERIRDLPRTVRAIGANATAHVQYPMLAWRRSATPLLLLLWLKWRGHRQTVLTLHEFSRSHWARRMVCVLLMRLSPAVVNTTSIEAESMQRWLPGKVRSETIPIASNITLASIAPINQVRSGIIFFGLLAPNKGLEHFLSITQPWTQTNAVVSVIGHLVPSHEAWMEGIVRQFPGVSFFHSLADHEVSRRLRQGLVALLPYPDGISERRGSALAALEHGLQVVTTGGRGTTPELAQICHIMNDEAHARQLIQALLNSSQIHVNGAQVSKYLSERTWPAVARHHRELYAQLHTNPGVDEWR